MTTSLPGAQFEVVTDLVDRVRRHKSDEEIAFLRKAAAITDQAFAAAVQATKPGARNIDSYNAILFETHRAGGMLCFTLLGCTLMADPNMAFPDAYISDRPIGKGDVIVHEHSSTAPLLHGWGNFLEPPIMGIKGSRIPIMDWTFERGETIVIEPNPCTPDLKSGVFLGDLCVITEDGAETLHTYPIDRPIVVEGF